MRHLELGQYWCRRLLEALPQSSTRLRTRLAWRLAALDVRTDSSLADLAEADLLRFQGGTRALAELRSQYLGMPVLPSRIPVAARLAR